MNPVSDPIFGLETCGYTEREAAFLYLVGIHSGYFLRRQFLAFLQRKEGEMVQRFLEKTRRLGHVHPIAYQHERHIYHLKAKRIYGLLGQPDSQNRREKGDRQIKTRLMQLDYVIHHLPKKFLETEQEKLEFFSDKLGVPLKSLPYFTTGEKGRRYFPDRFPISVEETSNEQPRVTFAYIDDGMRTVSAFIHWLDTRAELLRALSRAEVVYVSDTEHNLSAAEHEFEKRFPRNSPANSLPRTVEHFIKYLRLRCRVDDGARLSWDEMGILSEGERLYRNAECQQVIAEWRRGTISEASVYSRFAARPKPPAIRGFALMYDYPVWSLKYRRAVV